MPLARPTLILLPLLLAACGGGDAAPNEIDALDAELTEGIAANAGDPLLASVLQDPILVDPELSTKANADAVRPPAQPYSAPIPSPDLAPLPVTAEGDLLKAPAPSGMCRDCPAAGASVTLAALAARQTAPLAGRCAAGLRYGAGWAVRLPRDLPLHPSARVVEAAGNQDGGCALRVVSFTVAQPMATVIDWYYTRAIRAGYSAEHQADRDQHVLGGARRRDGGAYILFLGERTGGGTAVDLISNRGI